MSEYFIGEIRMFGGSFAPMDWAQCDGQTLSISQNDVLYSLIGVTYGGDGINNFKLPDLRGRVPIHMGTGTGLTSRIIGQSFGTEAVTLQPGNLPSHTHALYANSAAGTTNIPAGNMLAAGASTIQIYNAATTSAVSMNSASLTADGGSQAHSNLMPTLCVNFIIALSGIYPTRP
jgi:microcystin-dependent protein